MTSESLGIKPARINDLDSVWEIIKSCSDWLEIRGLDHWAKYYTKDLVAQKITTQEVFLYFNRQRPIAIITLDTKHVSYYTEKDISSFTYTKSSGYITALAVFPNMQNQGVASKLLNFVENASKGKGIEYIRLDCRNSYKELVSFYIKRGYIQIGTIIDEDDNNEEYSLMEKCLV